VIVNTKDFIATVSMCIVIISGLYALTIVPLEKELDKVQVATAINVQSKQRTHMNTETLERQDTRIDKISKQIQQAAISAAKREVQLDHLTTAIKELNALLKSMRVKGEE
jgi:predicted ribosome quality control (RQC) complex YloA/Tae2 family protein